MDYQSQITLIATLGGTVIGFILAMIWDNLKKIQQEKNILEVLKCELLNNEEMLNRNNNIIDDELSIVDQNKSVIIPLSLINDDFLNLFFITMPKKIRKNPDLLLIIRNLSKLNKENNETINSRESYRINNGAMSNYNSRIKIYDQIIKTQINNLIIKTEELIQKL